MQQTPPSQANIRSASQRYFSLWEQTVHKKTHSESLQWTAETVFQNVTT